MQKPMRKTAVVVIPFVLLLGGCQPEEPSEADMQQAIQHQLAVVFGPNQPTTVTAVKKNTCEKSGDDPLRYTCTIALSEATDGRMLVSGKTMTSTKTIAASFIKQGDLWVVDLSRH